MPFQRERYPADWPEISLRIREREDWCCKWCGAANGQPHPDTGSKVVMARFILDIHERQGVTILLIEHDMGLVMDIADRVVVLDFGTKIAEGTPEEIRNDETVNNAYLGKTGIQ